MKIAIIAYPYLRWFAGAERYVDELSRFLARYDTEVTIVASEMTFSRSPKREVKHCKVKEIQTYFMPGRIPKYYLENILFEKKCENYLNKYGNQFDIINGQAINALPAILSKPYHKKPVICTTYNTPWRRVLREQEIEVYNKVDGIVALTQYLQRILVDKYEIDERKIRVIYEGVDLDKFNSDRYSEQVNNMKKNLGHDIEIPFIFTLQRMDDRKDMNFLIDALKSFVDRYHVPVYVGGSGPKFKELKDQLDGYHSKIKLLGYIDDFELPIYYAAADIFISATWGQVVLESLASKTATILINDHPCCEEYIENSQDGYLIDKDSSILVEKLGNLLCNKDIVTKFKNNGLRKVHAQFNWASLTREILNFFKGVTA